MVAIFVLTAFLLILSVDLIVLKIEGKNHPAFEPSFPQYDFPIFEGNNFNVPSNIFLSKGHTWLKKNKNGLIDIGIDAFGKMALGQLSIVECAKVDRELKRGEMIFEGRYGDKTIKFLSPVTGIVKSVNPNIYGKKISDPYESWGVQVVSKEFPKNQDLILSGSEALNWMKKEYTKLKSFVDNHSPKVELAGATMYDGGSYSNDTVSSIVYESANDFEKEFLSL